MPFLSEEEQQERYLTILTAETFAEAAQKLGGITKEALQEWARDNPKIVPEWLYETRLVSSDRQREHLERARAAPPPPREIPWANLRFHCLGPCNAIYDTYSRVISHRRGAESGCKGADYTVVLPDETRPAPGLHEIADTLEELESRRRVYRAQVAVQLPHDLEDEEELLRAIVSALDERDLLRERVAVLEAEAARRRTVWSSVRERLGRGK